MQKLTILVLISIFAIISAQLTTCNISAPVVQYCPQSYCISCSNSCPIIFSYTLDTNETSDITCPSVYFSSCGNLTTTLANQTVYCPQPIIDVGYLNLNFLIDQSFTCIQNLVNVGANGTSAQCLAEVMLTNINGANINCSALNSTIADINAGSPYYYRVSIFGVDGGLLYDTLSARGPTLAYVVYADVPAVTGNIFARHEVIHAISTVDRGFTTYHGYNGASVYCLAKIVYSQIDNSQFIIIIICKSDWKEKGSSY